MQGRRLVQPDALFLRQPGLLGDEFALQTHERRHRDHPAVATVAVHERDIVKKIVVPAAERAFEHLQQAGTAVEHERIGEQVAANGVAAEKREPEAAAERKADLAA